MKKNIKKVKKYQKPLICLVVMLLMILSFIVGKITNANADDVSYDYLSSEIGYDSTSNSLNATNVKDAIDELYAKVGQCPKGYNCLTNEEFIATGSKFLRAYTYDESVCVTGNETGCVIATCIEDGTTCPVGTIIDYFVNNAIVVRFHVLHDDGETMTIQSQSNTISNVQWNSNNSITEGPITVMSELKRETDDWINVNVLQITSETTNFTGVNSIYNACSYNSEGNVICSGNAYDVGAIANTYRARMITLQEATDSNIGQCKSWVSESLNNVNTCKKFMINDKSVYWTMGVAWSTRPWIVRAQRDVHHVDLQSIAGARAVVVVNK